MENSWVVIIGAGVVGRATMGVLRWPSWTFHDPAQGFTAREAPVRTAIVCTPCPGGALDCLDVLERLNPCEVVVRSTVTPAALDELAATYARVVHWPEWLTELSADHDAAEPDKVVLGLVRPDDRAWVSSMMADLFGERFPVPAHYVSARASTLAKIGVNSYYAVKCWLMNLLWEVAGDPDAYADVCSVLALDQRIQLSHHRPFTGGYLGFGGKCLPKDLAFLGELVDDLDGEAIRSILVANEARVRTSVDAREPHPEVVG